MQDCDRQRLNDLDFVREAMLTAARDCGATIMGESFHRFSPQGVSGVVVIAESHLSIHSWPEYDYAAVDIFTCGTTVVPEKAVAVLVDRFRCRHHAVKEILRGLPVTV